MLPRRLLALDRDGTLIRERHYLASPEGVELLPGAAAALREFRSRGYAIVIVTNQSGIARGYLDADELARIHARVMELLAAEGATVDAIHHCPHLPDAGCSCRKPEPGLLQRALAEYALDAEDCLVVGDKECDVDLGNRLGAETALVRTGYGSDTERRGACSPHHVVDDLLDLASRELVS